MSIQFDIAKQIIAETCPNRKLKLENIRLFADIIQPKKYQKGPMLQTLTAACGVSSTTMRSLTGMPVSVSSASA